MNVYYFALSENQQLLHDSTENQLQVVIDQIFNRPTIIVISSEAYRANILFSITDTYPTVKSNFIANIQYILVNSKLKATFKFKDQSLSSQVAVKYYCDDSCGSDSYVSIKDSYIWNSGGAALESEIRQRIGASYTTFVGCPKSSSFSFVNPLNDCSNGDTNTVLAIVLSVVLGSCCLTCLCTCCLSLLTCVAKIILS